VHPAVTDPPEVQEALWQGVSGDVGWDVGANCGQSIEVMRGLFRRVVSFEPSLDSFDYAVRANPGAEIHRLAVSDHDGVVDLALIDGEQADTGQLVTPGVRGMEWDPGDWGGVAVVQVPCLMLDTLTAELGAPEFVKIDTEGHELQVLLGGVGLLGSGRVSWLVEFHSADLHDRCTQALAGSGHQVETIRHPHYPAGSAMWHQHGWVRAWPG
jgi:FkbM family methyltransferase